MTENKKNENASSSVAIKSASAKREEKILEFWREKNIFQKSLDKKNTKGEFVFFEGPPTANGKPGIHHLEARAFKDIIPRYKTMQGYHVRRKGGWDTHGLPVELQVEKKLGLNSKKAIEEYGVAKFNTECKQSVWDYLEFWNSFTERIGYWVDQENPYVTYENNYIESLWSVVKKIDDQDLIYKDYKVVPWCPRCGTTLSSHELAQGYEDVKDLSLYVKFKVKNQENTFILAWTTTPWTLPGNVALAVGEEIHYVEVEYKNENLILAKARISILTEEYKIVKEIKGKDLIGTEYEPLFPYFENTISEDQIEKMQNAFKVYGADFVTTEDGTGVVHTAVMYGADDFDLGNKVNLPKHHLVTLEGKFIVGTDFLEGRFVKEKDGGEVDGSGKPTLDVDIIKYLQEKNLFFHKELYEHSYPHCWRCKTPLIYYARDSWYIRMSDPKIKDQMIKENESINWEPSHIREGRFGEWLSGIKDWAISRERYWGTPLPVWVNQEGGTLVVDSLDTIKKYGKKSGNGYFVARHGEGEHNISGKVSFSDGQEVHLTEKGIEEAKALAENLKSKNITKIFSSPFARTIETAEIVADILGIAKGDIIKDERLTELNPGIFDGKTWAERTAWARQSQDHFYESKPEGGESHLDAKIRFGDFLYETENKYRNENVLIVTHGIGIETLPAVVEAGDMNRSMEIYENTNDTTGTLIELDFTPLPHNTNYELDLHKPYIDEIVLMHEGKEYNRVKEVMDVWFDSGAMPFAQDHYPFENKELVDGAGYPADFISEAIDQTRGWFYTLHAVGTLMGKGKAYKNVICLGHLLDAKGKKMSKSQGNIVDPWEMMDKYGVDTLRLWMYSVNQPGESKSFDEKTVAILQSQVFTLLYNVLAFYDLYRDKDSETNTEIKSENILDKWILARFALLVESASTHLDGYKILEPARAIRDFIGDLSTWYLRRSRERLKDEAANPALNGEARQTLYFVLKNLVKVMAPFSPFASEDIWQKLKLEGDEESVHLCEWPKAQAYKAEIIEDMDALRDLVSIGLQMRQKNNIPVRQPLNSFTVSNKDFKEELLEILKEELNVKDIILGGDVSLDIEITPELKIEGNYRELVRALQDIRKQKKLIPTDVISISVETNDAGKNLITKFKAEMQKTIGASEIIFTENDGEEIKVDEVVFRVKIL